MTHSQSGAAEGSAGEVVAERAGRMGFITLNRPRALNALSLSMVRTLTAVLQAWRDDPQVLAVAVRGQGRDSAFGAYCAGGDIRFFHQAATDGALESLDAFFTEEYALNHLIQTYTKPYIAFMDGVVMGGGMGISQGGSVRIVTERTRMAMPETAIGLFPDVGGGYFLSRCPGSVGEYLGLVGEAVSGRHAVAWGLADGLIESVQLPGIWDTLMRTPFESAQAIEHWLATRFMPPLGPDAVAIAQRAAIDRCFSHDSAVAIEQALRAEDSDWARATHAALLARSPLMVCVTLAQIRRARHMGLADDLRMERDMVWHCFRPPAGRGAETVEGIRALAIDKDHAPRWSHGGLAEVSGPEVDRFFVSPWPPAQHPLAQL